MPENLSKKTADKIHTLCSQISVANDLDEEIQEELYSHLEEKLLAYLSGREIITEDDSFILVREHFGDPSNLKGLLKAVHTARGRVYRGRFAMLPIARP
jgi:hypothetical protein